MEFVVEVILTNHPKVMSTGQRDLMIMKVLFIILQIMMFLE
jgi:hypothetical protein